MTCRGISQLACMIIYSVTVSIDKAIEEDWLNWMKGKHIPDVMATGHFESWNMQMLLDPEPAPGQATYNIQYECVELSHLELYQENHAPQLQAEHTNRYKDRFAAFRTLLRRI